MFVIDSCHKIEYNALFMMIFIPVSNFGDQPLCMIYHLKANQFAVFFQYSANFKLTFHVEKGLNFSYIGFLKLANFRTRFSKRDHCVI